MKRLPLLLIMIALLALDSGCAPRVPSTQQPIPLTAGQLLARLQNRANYWSGYQAQLDIDVASDKGKFYFHSIILAQLPGAFRLESFDPFGRTIAVLVFHQGKATLYIPPKNLVYAAGSPQRLIEHFLGIPLPLQLFAYSLAACVPPQDLRELRITAAQPGWLADVNNPQLGQSLAWQFNFDPPALQQVTIKSPRQEYSINYRPSAGLDLQQTPRQIRFVSSQWQMRVTVSQMKILVKPKPGIFNLTVPSGTQRIDLDTVP